VAEVAQAGFYFATAGVGASVNTTDAPSSASRSTIVEPIPYVAP